MKYKIQSSLFGQLLIGFILFSGCNTGTVYEKNHDFKNKFWHMDSVPHFSFRISDTETAYDIKYHMRNTTAYPFYNIYVKYYLEDSLGNSLSSKMKNFHLFNPKTGKPQGSGLGDLFSHEFALMENYQFDSAGTYSVKLEHFMRRDSLPEIISVGVQVKKAVEEE